MAIDQGPIGWPSMFWLFCGQGARGAWTFDWFHRTWNNIKLAVKDAGLWMVTLETAIIINYFSGPWSGQALFRQLQGLLEEYMLTSSADTDPLFHELYEDIVMDKEGFLPADFGTQEHMGATWSALPLGSCFVKKPDKLKLCRWMSWLDSATEMLTYSHSLLLVLLYHTLTEGSAINPEEMPVHARQVCITKPRTKQQQQPAAETRPAATGPSAASGSSDPLSGSTRPAAPAGQLDEPSTAGSAEPRGVKYSTEEIDRLREQYKNTTILVTRILCNSASLRLARVIVTVCKPVRQQHAFDVHDFKKFEKTQQWHLRMARGGYSRVLAKTWSVLQDPLALEDMGFQMQVSGQSIPGNPADSHPAEWHEDIYTAGVMLTLSRSLVSHMLHSSAHFLASLPGMFALLISTDTAERKACLQKLSRLWGAPQGLEAAMLADRSLQAFHTALVWPHMTWVREVLLACAEYDWQHVPAWVSDSVRAWASRFGASVICEDMFNKLRDLEADSKKGHVSRCFRWWKCVSSGIMEDYDTEEVSPHGRPATLDANTKIPWKAFDPRAVDYSLGEESTKSMGSKAYPSPSPGQYDMVPAATRLLSFAASNLSIITDAWQSLLVEPGCFLFPAGVSRAWYVTSVTQYGCWAWPTTAHQEGGWKYFTFNLEDRPG